MITAASVATSSSLGNGAPLLVRLMTAIVQPQMMTEPTAAITAIHFNHDYGHAGGMQQVFTGPEAVRNRELMSCDFVFSLVHASHVLSDGSLKKRRRMIGQHLERLGFRCPPLLPTIRVLRDALRPFRRVRGS